MARNKFASSVLSSSVGIAIGAVCVSWANIASAIPPANILGSWKVIANQSPETLAITSEFGEGGAGCDQIAGTLVGSSSSSQFPGNTLIVGYYCPSTGRLAFSRTTPGSGFPFQIWVGNVSDVGIPNLMGGTFHILYTLPGTVELGEYPFQGQK